MLLEWILRSSVRSLPCLLVVLGSLSSECSWGLESTDTRPNIVIFVADDLGWDDLGAYGNPDVQTPNIDRLAAGGLRFDNAFLTTASCSPSRGSILTGRYPHSNGSMHLHQGLPRNEATLVYYLRTAGYHTVSAGKWHVGRYARLDFDLVIEDNASSSGAVRWVDQVRARPWDKPFFFWFASHDPHRPFDDASPDLPAAYDPQSLQIPRELVDGPGTRGELAAYYREVSRFDAYVGAVLEELAAQGALHNTLVIVMSDNGRPFHFGKLTLYDAGIKTPFIVHWPAGIPVAGTRQQLMSAVDIAPGLVELAGLEPVGGMQGRSFAPLLQSGAEPIRDAVFAERNWHGRDAHSRAIRTSQFFYKENRFPRHGHCHSSQFGASPAYRELAAAWRAGDLSGWWGNCFSRRADFVELYRVDNGALDLDNNLAGRPGYWQQLMTLQGRLRDWREGTDDRDFKPYTAVAGQ